ncbi:sigma factor [Polyangium aurulentum]|uniref:sigma factor n=1 Tax=Polyangium aurulentum TaxID=2567896 RepID=UPI0010AE6438|nr:sigma factor [Polyangium aurulentum]UQA63222.1 hypothetical protein E8A73_023265 [Polyangium aurulentum]
MSPVEEALFVEALYKAHAAAVLAKLRRLGIEEPALEDLLQDVFVVAWRRHAKIPKDAAGARRWLLDSARKHAANFHRLYRHKYEELNPDAIEAARAEPADPEAHAELSNLVRSALRELASEDAELLLASRGRGRVPDGARRVAGAHEERRPRAPRTGQEPKVRLNLELPERLRGRLEQLRVMSEADTMTEVVRRAVALYDALMSAIQGRGEKVILRGTDGTERELIIL